jgi:lipopolysaccharide/colanic/teichoic acid biosynthesis glycosyltransferase
MVKRLFDVTFALCGLILLAPLLLVTGVLIKLDSPGPVLYRGERVGEDGVLFRMFKFRTMVVNADQMGSALTHSGDPRITRVGRTLRHWKVDELPQLINVLRGDMSLVGPRPESPRYVGHYTPAQREVLSVRPGVMGLTQVRFRHEEALLQSCANLEVDYVETIMPQKLALDLEYIAHQSLLVDLELILQTLLSLFRADKFTEPEHEALEPSATLDGRAR